MDYGYEGQVLLPITIDNNAALKPGETTNISADLRAIVCREVCIPAKAHLTLSMPVRAGNPEPEPATKALFADAMKALPKPLPSGWKVSAKESKDTLELRIRTAPHIATVGAWFAPLNPEQIDNAVPQQLKKEGGEMLLVLKKSDHLLQPLARLQGALILPAGAYTVDVLVSHPIIEPPINRRK